MVVKPGAMVGTRAPDFRLVCTQGPGTGRREVGLAEFQDRWLMLLFYPRDFSLVCPTELTAVSGRMAEFRRRECDVVGVSTDPPDTHDRWLGTPPNLGGLGALEFPLASDESGEACRAFGVYVARQHLALRGIFIIDPNGVLQYQAVHSLSVGRSTDELLRVLDALQTGGLCPGEWEPGQPPIDPQRTLGPGVVFAHQYRIEAVVGSGTFGTVYRAWDQLLERTVALKLIHTSGPRPIDSVLAEARAAAALNHPNICAVHTIEASGGTPLIVMEFVEGQALDKVLAAGRPPVETARSLGRQLAAGMAAAHQHGVVHGDLKPANILVTPEGVAKVMDFGLARRAPTSADATTDYEPGQGHLSGTPSYMSPEQARGEPATPASDVFALGLILFELATGRRAIGDGGNLFEVLRQIENLDPERLAAQTPEPIAGLIRRALVADPGRREVTMAEIAEALER